MASPKAPVVIARPALFKEGGRKNDIAKFLVCIERCSGDFETNHLTQTFYATTPPPRHTIRCPTPTEQITSVTPKSDNANNYENMYLQTFICCSATGVARRTLPGSGGIVLTMKFRSRAPGSASIGTLRGTLKTQSHQITEYFK